jgi:hypothetical protein
MSEIVTYSPCILSQEKLYLLPSQPIINPYNLLVQKVIKLTVAALGCRGVSSLVVHGFRSVLGRDTQ